MKVELHRPLLEGLDTAGGAEWTSGPKAEREDTRLLRLDVLRRIALHPEIPREDAIVRARRSGYLGRARS